jgi:hypothetical protein
MKGLTHFMETQTHLLFFNFDGFLLWSNKEDGFPCLLGHIFATKPSTMDTFSHEANWEHFYPRTQLSPGAEKINFWFVINFAKFCFTIGKSPWVRDIPKM